jgi:hypothetical protein
MGKPTRDDGCMLEVVVEGFYIEARNCNFKVVDVLLRPLRLLDVQNQWYISLPRHHKPLQHMEVKHLILSTSISQAVVCCAQISDKQRA